MKARRAAFVVGAALLGAALGHGGCSCGSDEDTAAVGPGAGGGPGGGGSGGAQLTSGPGSGGGGSEPCAEVVNEATIVNRPVDIIVAIDNSGSMSGEISEVEVQMTQNFAAILGAADPPIDYRIIMLSQHGSNVDQNVCIAAPLGAPADADMDGHCDTIPAQPTDTATFFHHSKAISSHNALCRFREQFDAPDQFGHHPTGYKDLLRDDSFKFFLVITDDRPSNVQPDGCPYVYDDKDTVIDGQTMAAAWDTDMLALSPLHFGTATERNYTFWSIVALAPYNATVAKPYGDPQPPDAMLAPVTVATCPNSPACNPSCAVNSGTGYQALSILSGGYRYPTCPVDYSEIFTLMAEGVIEGAKVPCEIPLPAPPEGQTVDLSTLEVLYESNDALVETFTRVDGPGDCDEHSFWIENDTIILCPDACATVQADDAAKLSVQYDCGVPPR